MLLERIERVFHHLGIKNLLLRTRDGLFFKRSLAIKSVLREAPWSAVVMHGTAVPHVMSFSRTTGNDRDACSTQRTLQESRASTWTGLLRVRRQNKGQSCLTGLPHTLERRRHCKSPWPSPMPWGFTLSVCEGTDTSPPHGRPDRRGTIPCRNPVKTLVLTCFFAASRLECVHQ